MFYMSQVVQTFRVNEFIDLTVRGIKVLYRLFRLRWCEKIPGPTEREGTFRVNEFIDLTVRDIKVLHRLF